MLWLISIFQVSLKRCSSWSLVFLEAVWRDSAFYSADDVMLHSSYMEKLVFNQQMSCYMWWRKQTERCQQVDPSSICTWRQQLHTGGCNQRQTVASGCRCGDNNSWGHLFVFMCLQNMSWVWPWSIQGPSAYTLSSLMWMHHRPVKVTVYQIMTLQTSEPAIHW